MPSPEQLREEHDEEQTRRIAELEADCFALARKLDGCDSAMSDAIKELCWGLYEMRAAEGTDGFPFLGGKVGTALGHLRQQLNWIRESK